MEFLRMDPVSHLSFRNKEGITFCMRLEVMCDCGFHFAFNTLEQEIVPKLEISSTKILDNILKDVKLHRRCLICRKISTINPEGVDKIEKNLKERLGGKWIKKLIKRFEVRMNQAQLCM